MTKKQLKNRLGVTDGMYKTWRKKGLREIKVDGNTSPVIFESDLLAFLEKYYTGSSSQDDLVAQALCRLRNKPGNRV